MSKLLIEQLTEEVEKTASFDKTAEEAEMEKIAHVVNVIDQAQTLSLVGEEMYKIAEALGNEEFAALAADTYQLGERMGSCLSKTASEGSAALEESLEIAEDMNKIASVYAEIADEVQNEEFNKLAEAVIAISNEMTDEANEVYEALEKEADETETEDETEVEKEASVKNKLLRGFVHAKKGLSTAKDAFSAKGIRGHVSDTVAASEVAASRGRGDKLTSMQALRKALTHGKDAEGNVVRSATEARKSLIAPAVAYGGAAAALAGAGYGAKKAFGKKD